MQWVGLVTFGCLSVGAVKVRAARWRWQVVALRVLDSSVGLCRSKLAMVPSGGMWCCLGGRELRVVVK